MVSKTGIAKQIKSRVWFFIAIVIAIAIAIAISITGFLNILPIVQRNISVLYVIVYEILFGDGRVRGGGAIKKIVEQNQARLQQILKDLMKERDAETHQQLLPIEWRKASQRKTKRCGIEMAMAMAMDMAMAMAMMIANMVCFSFDQPLCSYQSLCIIFRRGYTAATSRVSNRERQ